MDSKRKTNVLNFQFLGLFLAFIVFSLSLGQIMQYPEYPGEVGLHVNVINTGDYRDHDVKVTAYMPEEGDYAESNYFSVSRECPVSQSLFFDIPAYTQPGWHIAIVNLFHKDRLVDSQYVYVDTV